MEMMKAAVAAMQQATSTEELDREINDVEKEMVSLDEEYRCRRTEMVERRQRLERESRCAASLSTDLRRPPGR
jgi:hypothetical protein